MSPVVFETYQTVAIDFLAVRRRGLVKGPAGCGKTIIAAGALARVIGRRERVRKVRVGWLANTREQCQQAFKALCKVFLALDVSVDDAEREWLKRSKHLPLTVKVACAAADVDWSDCDVLVVDEAHHATAPEWFAQIRRCPNALWGFTATPDNEQDPWRTTQLLNLFGGELHEIPREAVRSRIAHAKVVLLDAFDAGRAEHMDNLIALEYQQRLRHWGGDPGKLRSIVAWGVVVEHGIVGNLQRNSAAVAAARTHVQRGDQVLMLVNQVEHGRSLADRVPGSRMCNSAMGAGRRRDALEAFRRGKVKCLVATSLADEGLDLPNANVLVLVSGGRSRAKAEQRTGRVLRAFAGKEHGLIYDFVDAPHGLMSKHSRLRVALYRELGYEICGELNLNQDA